MSPLPPLFGAMRVNESTQHNIIVCRSEMDAFGGHY